MNEKVLHTLEYTKIIDRLTELAASPLGKESCRSLLPKEELSQIQQAQKETSEALSCLLKKGSLSFSGVKDIRPSLMRLEAGASLNAAELLQISSLLNAALRAKAYGRDWLQEQTTQGEPQNQANPLDGDSLEVSEDKSTFAATGGSLASYFEQLEPLTPLNNEIKRCILSEEDISDNASPDLHRIRRAIKNTNNRVHEQLNAMVSSSGNQSMLQESIVTMRNGRYCIPVKAEYKNHFGGMVHDQSSSGSTLFIEPMAVVKLNNELRELAMKETEEIEKILANLSNQAAEYAQELKWNLDAMCTLDFLFAKASLSRQMKGSEPKFNQRGYIRIKKGRHPLLDPKKAVPIDLELGRDYHLLIVTGPNTGGKTVSLKTVGLFTLMGQSGLHIPAFDGSELSVFSEVYADIGDEQSIEQSLSTFSSHMVNDIEILKKADESSLVLFDELGAGTDPTEGAALAMSILNDLHQRGIRAMATTHYSELKIYALSTDGVENACCEFDVETLRPTYRLLIGIPGKSNAFAITQKLGMPEYIIDNARSLINSKDQSFEDVIASLEESRVTIEQEQKEIKRYKEEITALKQQLQKKQEKLESSKEKILQDAKEQARDILQEAKDFADESIRKYHKYMKDGGLNKEMERDRAALRDRLKASDSKLGIQPKKKTSTGPKKLQIGDAVQVLSMNLKGIVSTLPNDKGDLFVQMGILRSQVNINDLELIDEPEITAPSLKRTGSGKISMSKSSSIRPEINLIGKTVDEAISLLDKYLDDAYLSHLPKVTVIHGRGTGALKNAVHQHLKRTKYVKSYRIGEFGEGDHGVTIVEFKN